MADYVALAALAKRLIEANGRSIAVVIRSSTPTDATKPWRGTDGSAVTLPVIGLFTDLEYSDETHSFVRRGRARILVAATSTKVDLTSATLVIDGSRNLELESVKLVQPGPVPMIWDLTLKR